MTAVTCPRCGGDTRPVRLNELTTHYRCPADGCDPPSIYMGEHPAKFWTLLVAEILYKIALAVYLLGKRLAIWGFTKVADVGGDGQ